MSIIDVDAFLATKVSSDLEESVFIPVHLSLRHTSAGVRDISIQLVKSDGVWAYDPFQCVCRFMCVECIGTCMWRSEDNLRLHSLGTAHGLF